MKVTIVVAVVLCAKEALNTVHGKGHRVNHRNGKSARIKGGQDVTSFIPYFAVVEKVRMHNEETFCYQCGGTILNADTVVTAAHCVDNADNATKVYAYAGYINSSDPYYQGSSANQTFIHPDYLAGHKENDIAILKLNRAFEFNDRVGNITLPSKTDVFPTGTAVTMYGFGRTAFAPRGVCFFTCGAPEAIKPEILQFANLNIHASRDCKNKFITYKEYMMYCVGNSSVGGRNEDSGTPLVFNWSGTDVFVGVLTFTARRPFGKKPTYYVKTTYFLEFITHHL